MPAGPALMKFVNIMTRLHLTCHLLTAELFMCFMVPATQNLQTDDL